MQFVVSVLAQSLAKARATPAGASFEISKLTH
jgi:hypothetical protein